MTDTNAFWQFSLSRYPRPGVAALCLEAQSRHGADVNLLLFGLWLGSTGRLASPQGILSARETVRDWHEEVVRPLRRSRSWMKHCNLGPQPPREALREKIKQLEIEAERQEQSLLFALSSGDWTEGNILFPPGSDPRQAMAANLAAFLDAPPDASGEAPLREALVRLCF